MKRKRLREYTKHGKSLKYHELCETFELKMKEAIQKYKDKLKVDVLEGKRGSTYPALRRMGLRPGESVESGFHLPKHADKQFTPLQPAEAIAEHFSRISQEFEPLSLQSLPPNIRSYLEESDSSSVPVLTAADVKARIVKAKKPHGIVHGDFPKKLLQRCPDQIARPAVHIFNAITRTATFPSQWKIEHQIAIPKVYPPKDEDDLRNIAKTPFLRKVYESFLAQWLLNVIHPFLDPYQWARKAHL